jgi:uncharacterized protein with FMN-binding domain
MKRVLLSVTGTVLGLVALLGVKTHGHAVTGGALPSAALPTAGATAGSPTPGTTQAGPTTSAPPDPSSTSSAAAPATRTVAGQAVQTQYGVVQVQVTVSGGKITHASFLKLTAYDDRSQQINSDAAPILLQETLSAQSAHIDMVSGASYTSEGYVESLQSALDQVGIR